MAKPLTDTERQAIIDALNAGTPYADIAQTTGRSTSTISRIAQSIGHKAGQTNLVRAREARSAYTAERRAEIAGRLTERVEEIIERMEGEFLVYNFGGSDNTYCEHQLDAPPVDALRAMGQTVRDLLRTVLDIDRHDNRADEGAAAVDQWLREIVGSGS